jgi:hypothetical protein
VGKNYTTHFSRVLTLMYTKWHTHFSTYLHKHTFLFPSFLPLNYTFLWTCKIIISNVRDYLSLFLTFVLSVLNFKSRLLRILCNWHMLILVSVTVSFSEVIYWETFWILFSQVYSGNEKFGIIARAAYLPQLSAFLQPHIVLRANWSCNVCTDVCFYSYFRVILFWWTAKRYRQ